MKLHTVDTGNFRLDGGAMFGVVPKSIWQKTNPANEHNRIAMALRCLLVEANNALVLIDNGLGTKYNAKFAELYELDASQTLDKSLAAIGFSRKDVTHLVLTHLHFDHCGGTTVLDDDSKPVIAFPNAKIFLQRSHWQWALHPNAREQASFFAENLDPIATSGQLELLNGPTQLLPGVELVVLNGHTEGQQLPLIEYEGKKLLFAADLFPTYGHLPLPYVMGYDVRPLVSLQERAYWLERCVQEEITLFYEHDPHNECGWVHKDPKGKYSSGSTFKLNEWL